MTKVKPFLSYYGGKQRIASKIVGLLPPHKIYVEPFAGGAAVLFAKGLPVDGNASSYLEVINDTDRELINFYRVMQNREKANELLWRLQWTPYSANEYRRAADRENLDDVELAARYAVAICQSFLNRKDEGWAFSRSGRNHADAWQNRIGLFMRACQRISRVYVEDCDAIKCIRKYDSPDTLFYCDPPYVDTYQGHYSGYMQEQLDDLISVLGEIKGKFVLSGYENVAYPSAWGRVRIKTAAGSACGRNGKGKGARTEFILRPSLKRK